MSKKNEKEADLDQDQELKNQDQNTEDTTPSSDSQEDLQAKVNELNDKHLRLYSEFENYRRRTAKERLELISSASEEVLKAILPVIDDFERAIASNENVDDVNALKEGFGLLYQKMSSILTSKGLKVMDAKEKPFDAELFEAVTKIPAPSKKLKGKVVDVIEKGYYLNEKIIRHAKVVIGE